MKRILLLLIIISLFLGLAGVSLAQQIGLSVPRSSFGSGTSTAGGDYQLSAITNQPIAGNQTGGDFDLRWGFWQPVIQDGTIYLPMVAKPGPVPSSHTNPAADGAAVP